jgi:hypothetical protein
MHRAALSAVVLASWAASSARADIPPPPRDLPSGKIPIPIEVSYAPDKDVTFLYLGREALESASDDKKKQTQWTPGTTRSIVAATALSLGVAGIFLLRGKRTAQVACGLVLLAGLGALGAEVWANAPAPIPNPPPPTPARPTDVSGPDLRPKTFHGDAVVEIVDGDGAHRVRLVIGTKPKPKYQRVLPPEPPTPPKTPEKKA